MAMNDVRSKWKHNLNSFRRKPLSEISGALGDLGTFLPILIALTQGHQISLSTTLIFTGIYNIATGIFFGIPLPVQPMKAIAAVALLRHLNSGEVAAAGIFVSACVLIFSITGLLRWFTDFVPIPVVKGIQVGAGLSLIIAAGSKALSQLTWFHPSWADNYFWLFVAFLALLALNVYPRTPYALIMTVVGIVFALIRIVSSHHRQHLPDIHVWKPHVFVPRAKEWQIGIIDAGLGQLPLTTLNSVVAVTHLAADLLPDVTTPSATAIGFSVAAMNLVGCWFGTMPVCHGSGGLAAQHKFGARSGSSVIFLGVLKLLLGLIFGESLTDLFNRFPTALLSVMIIAAGLELASVGESLNTDQARDIRRGILHKNPGELIRKRRWMVMLVTAGLLVGFKNDAIGFIGGLLCHYSFVIADKVHKRNLIGETEPLLS